jgi:hypothetical protein
MSWETGKVEEFESQKGMLQIQIHADSDSLGYTVIYCICTYTILLPNVTHYYPVCTTSTERTECGYFARISNVKYCFHYYMIPYVVFYSFDVFTIILQSRQYSK